MSYLPLNNKIKKRRMRMSETNTASYDTTDSNRKRINVKTSQQRDEETRLSRRALTRHGNTDTFPVSYSPRPVNVDVVASDKKRIKTKLSNAEELTTPTQACVCKPIKQTSADVNLNYSEIN